MRTNWRDVGFKTFWTAASAALAYLGTLIVDIDAEWVPIGTVVINVASAWVRQQLGATPPPAPPVR
jgi:hypothetical protein